jgi:hypothetical protein
MPRVKSPPTRRAMRMKAFKVKVKRLPRHCSGKAYRATYGGARPKSRSYEVMIGEIPFYKVDIMRQDGSGYDPTWSESYLGYEADSFNKATLFADELVRVPLQDVSSFAGMIAHAKAAHKAMIMKFIHPTEFEYAEIMA